MHRRRFLIAVLTLAGCATPTRPPEPLAELEPLYGVKAGRDGLVVTVGSNGCTAKGDFAFYVERKGGNISVAFARKRIDPCKSFAIGRTDLTFSWADLGIPAQARVALLNPLAVWRGP